MATQPLAVDTKPLERNLATLKERAAAIVVVDQETYSQACQIVLQGRKEVKAIGFALDPGIESAKNHLNELKQQKAAFVDRITPVISEAEQKAERWKAEERRKAKAEEDRINNERRIEAARVAEAERVERERKADIDRKAKEKEIEAARKAGEVGKREAERLKKEAEAAAAREKQKAKDDAVLAAQNVQTVTVETSVPKVDGIKARVNWKFAVIRPRDVNPAFLIPDLVAIGAKVRSDKDAAKSEAEIGGIHVFTEDSI